MPGREVGRTDAGALMNAGGSVGRDRYSVFVGEHFFDDEVGCVRLVLARRRGSSVHTDARILEEERQHVPGGLTTGVEHWVPQFWLSFSVLAHFLSKFAVSFHCRSGFLESDDASKTSKSLATRFLRPTDDEPRSKL